MPPGQEAERVPGSPRQEAMTPEPFLSPPSLSPTWGHTECHAAATCPCHPSPVRGITGTASLHWPGHQPAPGHSILGTRWEAVQSRLCTEWPGEAAVQGAGNRTPSSCLKEEGQAEPKPTLAKPGPGGSVPRGGGQEAGWLVAGQAGRRWQQRPGCLGDDIGAVWRPGASGPARVGRSVAQSPGAGGQPLLSATEAMPAAW